MHTDRSTRQQLADEKWHELHEQLRIARLQGRAARRSRSRRAAQLVHVRQTLRALIARWTPAHEPKTERT